MVRDLARDPGLNVIAVDAFDAPLERLAGVSSVETRRADLSDAAVITELARSADVVVGALPSRFGLMALETVVPTGTPYCDISFMPEDPLTIDALAREHGVTAVVDCGVAPGLANIIIGRYATEADEIDEVVFFVGGLPHVRTWPFDYKAPFAPSDVIEEYTRPARFIEGGTLVTRPALSDPEWVEVPGIGTLEGFNTDGLRSLLTTIPAKSLREKTLRYPGHRALMEVLRESGFFSQESITVDGADVQPLALTSRLLFDAWQLGPEESEFTYLEVRFRGRKAGQPFVRRATLFDEFDAESGEHSMSRTTGFPCTIVARWLASGAFNEPGVHPPERLGREAGLYRQMLDSLAERGVVVNEDSPA